MTGFLKLCGRDAAALADEALTITVFGDELVDMSSGQLLILVAWAFRRLQAQERTIRELSLDRPRPAPAPEPSRN